MKSGDRDAIRVALLRLGAHATPKQLVDELRRFGRVVSETFAAKAKSSLQREWAKTERERAKRNPRNKRRSRPQQRKVPPRNR